MRFSHVCIYTKVYLQQHQTVERATGITSTEGTNTKAHVTYEYINEKKALIATKFTYLPGKFRKKTSRNQNTLNPVPSTK
jgi:hypothetical protein